MNIISVLLFKISTSYSYPFILSTAAIGERLKITSMINKSLLCLGHVINALVDREAGNVRHIPFRNSKVRLNTF